MNHVISLLESARGFLFPWDLRKKNIISIVPIEWSRGSLGTNLSFLTMNHVISLLELEQIANLKNHLVYFNTDFAWFLAESSRVIWENLSDYFIRIFCVAFQYWFQWKGKRLMSDHSIQTSSLVYSHGNKKNFETK